jgi:signal transduction histidine kinase
MVQPVNILLVDDRPLNLAALESILDCADYRITKAESAQEALMSLFTKDFALIVLDVRMPEIGGLELAQLIKQRKRTEDIPIIFLTAHQPDDQHVLSGYGAGAVDYLIKPISPAILKSKVAVFAELYRKNRALNEANEILNQRNEALLAANKELEIFSYTISHDLLAPLRHVIAYVEALRAHEESRLDDKGTRYLDIIQDSARRLSILIERFLSFVRMGRAELKVGPVDMGELVRQARHILQAETADRRIEWQLPALPIVEADPALMLQVWINLLSNAIKYTRRSNPARIEVSCDESSRDEFVFFVRDNGVGFDMQYVDKLFGVFQRLHHDDEFEGTGIGLANVRRIIERHGGRTWAEGKLNSGATISFTFHKPDPTHLRDSTGNKRHALNSIETTSVD